MNILLQVEPMRLDDLKIQKFSNCVLPTLVGSFDAALQLGGKARPAILIKAERIVAFQKYNCGIDFETTKLQCHDGATPP